MAKKNTTFFCKECGYETNGWMGKCPGCGAWNSLVDAPTEKKSSSTNSKVDSPAFTASSFSWTDNSVTLRLSEAGNEKYLRHSTGIDGLDGLWGGGITEGSVSLVTGEPGIGKSTLLLQLANSYKNDGEILYVSGEESPSQINMRAKRLGIDRDILICAQTRFETIAEEMKEYKPVLAIIDSIQTLYSEQVSGTPGSITQAREVTAGLIKIAKSNNVPIILVGHVTKEGSIAGPKTLEHMVDTVLNFEGDGTGGYRILRASKNRFGSSSELAFFEMGERGLRTVDSSSALLLRGRPLCAPGSVLTTAIEGSGSIVVEIQSLVATSCYNNPQRMTSGPDKNRTNMLLAVCDKVFDLGLSGKDVFINIIGGLKITDPGADLAVATAIVSSARNIAVKENTMVIGEVGLSGEIRPVARLSSRIEQALKMGIKTLILPGSSREEVNKILTNSIHSSKNYDKINSFEYLYADNIKEAADIIFS